MREENRHPRTKMRQITSERLEVGRRVGWTLFSYYFISVMSVF